MITIIAAVPDMFFASKIRATAEHLGGNVTFIRNDEALRNAARRQRPDLIVVDLQALSPDPFELARTVRSDEELKLVPILGFYSHVSKQLAEQAKEAGFSYVIPRSVFSTRLADILAGHFSFLDKTKP